MKSIKVCEYSRSRSFHDDLMLQDQASVCVLRTNGPLVIDLLAKHKSGELRCPATALIYNAFCIFSQGMQVALIFFVYIVIATCPIAQYCI